MFDWAQQRLAENRQRSARNTKTPGLLQGLLVCGACGYAFYRASTRTNRRQIRYYRCLGSDRYRWPEGRRCSSRPVREDYEVISELNSPACHYPCQRFAARLTTSRRMTRGHEWSLAFILRESCTPYPLPALAGAFNLSPFPLLGHLTRQGRHAVHQRRASEQRFQPLHPLHLPHLRRQLLRHRAKTQRQ